MRSAIDISPENLVEILSTLALFGVKVVASRASENTVRLVIDGRIVPDAEHVDCQITRAEDGTSASATATFRALSSTEMALVDPPSPQADTACLHCNDTGWVVDENWTPDYPGQPQERVPSNGLIQCGICAWRGEENTPTPQPNVRLNEDRILRAANAILGNAPLGYGMTAAEAKTYAKAALEAAPQEHVWSFQGRVAAAHHAIFHDDPTDIAERLARYAEETNEVLQAFGMTREFMHQLVEYTCDRPAGEPAKEIGAALLTLTSLCVVAGYDLAACGEADLEKLQRPDTIARIRAKRATRHGRGPLPGLDPDRAATEGSAE